MKLDVYQCDLCKAEHRLDPYKTLYFMEVHGVRMEHASGCYTKECYKDLCETCEAEIKQTIERLKK